MMSIFLTEELENHTARRSDAEMFFFFCSAQDEKRNTGVTILRGILYQMIAKRPQLITHALPYFETPERTRQTLSSLETLWIIFTKLVADTALGFMFCVLDGLDECDESATRVLLPRINALLTDKTPSTTGMFRLVVVSREIHALRGCSCSRIRLDPDNDAKVYGDIELFVATRVQDLSEVEGFDSDFRSFLQESLVERAEETFLWVGFAMYELSQKETCTGILEVFEDLPTGLPAIYNRMLLQIPARHKELSQSILRWVTFAVHPLKLEELAAGVGLQSRHPQLTTEQVVRDAITRCGPLLEIQDQFVSLIHQSMYDYLLREKCDDDTSLDAFRLQKEPSHLELAQTCLDCLAQSSLQHKTIYPNDEIDPPNSPLLRYAISSWPEHAKNCSALAAKLIDTHGIFLKKTSTLRMHWWNSYNVDWCHSVESQELLHIACCLEIVPWVEAVLSKKSWIPGFQKRVNKKSKQEGQTALHLAAWKKDMAIVRLLLDKGADIEAENINGTALHIAASIGDTAVVRLLLDRGADVKAKELLKKTALHSAAEQGNEATVQLLLDRGADIKAREYFGNTPLHLAAMTGRKALVQLLLDRGANIEAENMFKRTALHLSAEKEEEDVVHLLVDRGADVNAKDYHGNTALHRAMMGRGESGLRSVKGTDPEKMKAICDFLRSRTDSSERSDINHRTAPDSRPLRNQHAISNPPTRPPNPFPREHQDALSQPSPYK
jgi:hypothetical protein